jgi:hypothetical protein
MATLGGNGLVWFGTALNGSMRRSRRGWGLDGRDGSAAPGQRGEETRTDGPDAGNSAGAMHAVAGRQSQWRVEAGWAVQKDSLGDTVRGGRQCRVTGGAPGRCGEW